MTTELTIFPSVTEVSTPSYQAPAAPVAPVTDALAKVRTELVTKPELDPTKPQFSCVDHLGTEQRREAQRRAVELVDAIILDTQVGVVYGNKQLEPVNQLVKELLSNEKATDLPELEERMKLLKRQMREIEGRQLADPKVEAFYTKWKNKLLSLIGMARGSWELLKDDVKSLDSHINDLERMLASAQRDLIQTIAQYDTYYVRNEEEIRALFGVIAVMELASLESADRATRVIVDENDPLNRGREERDKLAKVSADLENRVARMQIRLMIGFTTSVDIRGSRDLDVGLATLLSDMVRITIPTLRATVWKWMKAKKARDYARKAEATNDFANTVMNMYGQASIDTARIIANATETPLLSADTLLGMATALDLVANVVVEAMEAGALQRAENRSAITQGLEVLGGATDKVANKRLKQVLERVRAVPTEDVIPEGFAQRVLAVPTGSTPSRHVVLAE